jgi:import inner membrane translocase subunit TIM21
MLLSVATRNGKAKHLLQCVKARPKPSQSLFSQSAVAQGSKNTIIRPFTISSSKTTNVIQRIRDNKLSNHIRPFIDKPSQRCLSGKAQPPPPGANAKAGTPGDDTTSEIVLTPGQKVVAGTRLTMYLGFLGLGSVCAYFIGKELFPSKMSANVIFDKAFAKIQENEQIKTRFGAPLKAYGRDHGGHREGRRNFIEHTEFTDPDDGSKRTRVRFNLEGEHGHAFVFAEVSKDMPSGEFVYLLVQDKRGGRVFTLIDNRTALKTKQLMGGSKEGQDAFQQLLGSGKK